MPRKQTKKPETAEIATVEKDIDIFSGWTKRLENPDPVLRTESAGKGLKLYDEVDRDAHASAVLQTRYLSVVGKEWQIEPASPPPRRTPGRPAAETREQKIADFVSEAFLKTNFDQARQELLQGILYGYYVWEVMWGYSEGQIWIEKLVAKHPRRFSFTPERSLRLLTPSNMVDGEPVPDRKFIVFTYGSTDNPYGKGLGQKLWWPVWFKKHGIKFWVVFCEKFGSPTAVGKYPPGTSKEDQDKLLSAIEAIQQETGIIVPESMAVELLEASRTSSLNTYESLCAFMDLQISKAVLGQTLTTEVGNKGSYAAGRVHEKVREDILKADADLLCEDLNNSLVPWIVDYNFPDISAYPRIWIRIEDEPDLKALAERDKILVKDIGVPLGEQYFYDTYNLPRPEEGEALVSPPAPGMPGFREFQEAGAHAQDRVDRLAGQASQEAAPFFRDLIDALERAAGRAESLVDLRMAVPDLFEKLPDGSLTDHLAQTLLEADRIGAGSVAAEFQEARWGPGTPFEDALACFRDRALWISGITKAELLSDIKEELIRAIEEGQSLQEFQKAMPEIFERHGYTRANPWRIETIYRTNLQDAFQGGRLRQKTEPAVLAARPYWRYVATRDAATRPSHAAMHGKIYPADHPIWQTWHPPNGFNCRCDVQTLSAREVERSGWTIESEDPTGRLFEPTDPETGAKLPARALMPDPGWDHLPGRQDLRTILDERLRRLKG
jgi:SPP1 gp7 family putative phage head morphogenesis protein